VGKAAGAWSLSPTST